MQVRKGIPSSSSGSRDLSRSHASSSNNSSSGDLSRKLTRMRVRRGSKSNNSGSGDLSRELARVRVRTRNFLCATRRWAQHHDRVSPGPKPVQYRTLHRVQCRAQRRTQSCGVSLGLETCRGRPVQEARGNSYCCRPRESTPSKGCSPRVTDCGAGTGSGGHNLGPFRACVRVCFLLRSPLVELLAQATLRVRLLELLLGTLVRTRTRVRFLLRSPPPALLCRTCIRVRLLLPLPLLELLPPLPLLPLSPLLELLPPSPLLELLSPSSLLELLLPGSHTSLLAALVTASRVLSASLLAVLSTAARVTALSDLNDIAPNLRASFAPPPTYSPGEATGSSRTAARPPRRVR